MGVRVGVANLFLGRNALDANHMVDFIIFNIDDIN